MSAMNPTLASWNRVSTLPTGKWFFSKMVCFKAPYFSSISPRIEALRQGYCEVHLNNRRAVHNHIGTVHAIAMCNMAELAAGVMIDASLPSTLRWIPKGMTVEYLKKAQTNLVATTQPTQASDVPVEVNVADTAGVAVFRASIVMRVSPK
jgi:acyl-coenzyme A thioesterase PaaI-like protein